MSQNNNLGKYQTPLEEIYICNQTDFQLTFYIRTHQNSQSVSNVKLSPMKIQSRASYVKLLQWSRNRSGIFSPVQFSALVKKHTLKAGSQHSNILCNIVSSFKVSVMLLMAFFLMLTEIIFSLRSNWILSLSCGFSLVLVN